MGAARMAAFAAGGDRPGAQPRAELDHRNEAVAVGSVPAPGARISVGAERGERTPARGGEGDRDARTRVGEGLHDRSVVALEPVDLAPGRPPAAPFALEPIESADERVELVAAGERPNRLPHIAVRRTPALGELPQLLAPEIGESGGGGVGGPAGVP